MNINKVVDNTINQKKPVTKALVNDLLCISGLTKADDFSGYFKNTQTQTGKKPSVF